jgi:glyoxylase I family protein
MIFHHIGLNCADQAASERFYVEHFGFRRARVFDIGEGRQIIFLKQGESYLELFPAEGAPQTPVKDGPAAPGVRHLAFKVASVDAQLAAMGEAAAITLGPFSFDDAIPGWRTVWVADPDGNIVEISQGYRDE